MNEEELKRYQEKLQLEAVKKAAMFKFMTKDARERLNRVKVAHPDLAEKVELALMQAIQLGHLNGSITDVQLKNILTEIIDKKKTRIVRK